MRSEKWARYNLSGNGRDAFLSPLEHKFGKLDYKRPPNHWSQGQNGSNRLNGLPNHPPGFKPPRQQPLYKTFYTTRRDDVDDAGRHKNWERTYSLVDPHLYTDTSGETKMVIDPYKTTSKSDYSYKYLKQYWSNKTNFSKPILPNDELSEGLAMQEQTKRRMEKLREKREQELAAQIEEYGGEDAGENGRGRSESKAHHHHHHHHRSKSRHHQRRSKSSHSHHDRHHHHHSRRKHRHEA